jgi:hypothetical protein
MVRISLKSEVQRGINAVSLIDQQFTNTILNFRKVGFPYAELLLLSKEIDFFQSLYIGVEV